MNNSSLLDNKSLQNGHTTLQMSVNSIKKGKLSVLTKDKIGDNNKDSVIFGA